VVATAVEDSGVALTGVGSVVEVGTVAEAIVLEEATAEDMEVRQVEAIEGMVEADRMVASQAGTPMGLLRAMAIVEVADSEGLLVARGLAIKVAATQMALVLILSLDMAMVLLPRPNESETTADTEQGDRAADTADRRQRGCVIRRGDRPRRRDLSLVFLSLFFPLPLTCEILLMLFSLSSPARGNKRLGGYDH